MNRSKRDEAILALRVVLGAVVIIQAGIFAFGTRAITAFAHTGFPDAVRLVLAWSEIAAGFLFLMPPTLVLGAWSLLVVFCGAILLHLAHGQFEVGGLLVYSMAVIVIIVHRKSQQTELKATTV